jgi:subfamily B ATP-binding cassette protein MsbA
MPLKELKPILAKMSLKTSHFLTPTVLGVIASLFEMISVTLLIPIVNLIIRRDASSVLEIPFVGDLISAFPLIFDNKRVLFSFLCVLVFTSVLLKLGFVYGAKLSSTYVIRRFLNELRELIFEVYLNYGKRFFDRHNAGRLYQILMTHTQALGNQMFQMQSIGENLFMLMGYSIILFWINWQVTIFAVLIFVLLYYSMTWLIKKIERTSKDHSRVQMELGEKMSNALSCIELVKAYSNEKSEKENFNKICRRSFKFEYSIGKKMNLIAPVQEIIILIAVFFLLGVMSVILQRNPDPSAIGKFTVYFFVLKRASNVFRNLSEIKGVISAMSGPWNEVVRMLKVDEKYIVSDGKFNFSGIEREIRFKNLNFNYDGETSVLKDVNVTFKKGEMTALVGPTGSGKTTLANILMRYYECPTKTVFFDDVDIRDFSIKSIRDKIAIVSQDALLFNGSIKENILYGLERKVDEDEFVSVLKKARLYDFIMNTKDRYETRVGDRGVQLSGGEKQRISIARAMLKNADIFILDEATSALDSHTENMIQEAIHEMIMGKTTVVIAHRLSTVKKADAVVVLDKGNVIERGSPKDLLEKKGHFFSYLEDQKFK